MSTISHHPGDDLIGLYAAGSLEHGWSLAIASHLSLCPECRERLAAAEAAGGALLEALPAQAPVDAAWNALHRRLLHPAPLPPQQAATPAPAPSGAGPFLPAPLRRAVGGDLESLRWRPLGLGAYHLPIATHDGTSVRLLRIPAGRPVPEHAHRGRELTLVLCGAFADATGHYARGDLQDADTDLQHQPVADADIDCICLAVTDAPLRFRSWMVRAVQPLLGI